MNVIHINQVYELGESDLIVLLRAPVVVKVRKMLEAIVVQAP